MSILVDLCLSISFGTCWLTFFIGLENATKSLGLFNSIQKVAILKALYLIEIIDSWPYKLRSKKVKAWAWNSKCDFSSLEEDAQII